MGRLLLLSLIVSVGTACLRDVPDIPAVPEGGAVTGRVLVRDRISTQLVGLRGASVGIVGTSNFAATDERGFFQLQRVPLGSIVVTVTRPFVPGVPRAGRRLDGISILAAGQSLDLGEIELFGAGDVTGSVRVDADPAAGPGALVIAAQTGFKSIVGLDRAFVLPALPEGAFDVVAFLPSFDPATHGAVRVTANASVRLREIVFTAGGSADVTVGGSVTLTDTDDASPAAIRFVSEVDPALERTATAAADGRFTLALPAGSYRAHFTAPGHREVRIYGVAATAAGAIGLVPIHLSPEVEGDFDADDVPDAEDGDLDNDGCANADDFAPRDAYACRDADGDGLDDDLDPDDDNDGLVDAEEVTAGLDTWTTDPFDADTDADGPDDRADNCPTLANVGQEDRDMDGRGDACATITSTIPGNPNPNPNPNPTPTETIEAMPSLIMPGDVVRFTGPGIAGATAVRVGDLALETVTATTGGGVLATVPMGIAPGVARFTTPRGEVVGPRLSVLTVRPLPMSVRCAPGELPYYPMVTDTTLTLVCATELRRYDLATFQLLDATPFSPELLSPSLEVQTVAVTGAGIFTLAMDPATRELSVNDCTGLGTVPPLLSNTRANQYFNRLTAVETDDDVYLRSPLTGIWFLPEFCLQLPFPHSGGGVTALARQPGTNVVLVKHASLGFRRFRVGHGFQSDFDGQQGDPEFLTINPDGTVWGFGGTVGATLYRPFTSTPPTRVPGVQIASGSIYLVSPDRRWAVAATPTFASPFFAVQSTTTFIDLANRRFGRKDPFAGLASSATGVGPLLSENVAVEIAD